MSDTRDSTTLFYKLKLKRTRKPVEVFEKMAKSVKKRGATKNWVCEYDENDFRIDFGDEMSETFVMRFDEKKVCEDFCKVFFPLSGELFDDEKKSEFKALINMIYSARTSFSHMEITDDYGISESFLDTKVNKIALRELTEEELERAKRLFDAGHTTIKDFIIALMIDLRGLEYREDYYAYINTNSSWFLTDTDKEEHDFFNSFVESFLFETTEYKDQGRLYDVEDYYGDLNGVTFSTMAFDSGMEDVTDLFHLGRGTDPKYTQVLRLYTNKYLPLLEKEQEPFGRCLLAYRFFLSIFDYLGFKYVGRGDKYPTLILEETAACIKTMLENKDPDAYHNYEKAVEVEYERLWDMYRNTVWTHWV